MRPLLILTAALEASTGVALMALPALVVSLLVGASLDTPGGLVVARVAGAALLALSLACWLARDDQQSHAIRGIVAALVLYNVAAVAVLMHANLGLSLSGPGLWPVVGIARGHGDLVHYMPAEHGAERLM